MSIYQIKLGYLPHGHLTFLLVFHFLSKNIHQTSVLALQFVKVIYVSVESLMATPFVKNGNTSRQIRC